MRSCILSVYIWLMTSRIPDVYLMSSGFTFFFLFRHKGGGKSSDSISHTAVAINTNHSKALISHSLTDKTDSDSCGKDIKKFIAKCKGSAFSRES